MAWRKWNIRKWLDGFILAAKGILLATKERKFWFGFVPAFFVFGMLMNLLSGGFSKFELMVASGISGSLKILGDAFFGTFGVNRAFLDWLYVFLIAFLQGILIGLIVVLWDKKRGESGKESSENEVSNSANIQKAGIITGLIALGAGCPTCGTTLLAPLIGAIFSTGGLAITGAISGIVTALAIIIAILSLKRLGEETYVIIVNERFLKKRKRSEKSR